MTVPEAAGKGTGTLRLSIYCLDGFQVFRGAELIPPRSWNRKKTAQLFKYLVVAYRPVPVVTLLQEFWLHFPETAARHNLAVTLYNLRRVLEPELGPRQESLYIQAQGEFLQLNWDQVAFYDAGEFLRRRRQGLNFLHQGLLSEAVHAFTSAAELYREDFLADAASETWILDERDRLRTAYLDVLEHLGDALIKLGCYGQAYSYAERLVQLDPCVEEGHRMLMQIFLASGHRSRAIAQYRECREILKRQQGVNPGPQTEELYHRIVGGEN